MSLQIATPGFFFLKKASMFYKDLCPEQSRFLMRRHQNLKPFCPSKNPDTRTAKRTARKALIPEEAMCPFCFQWRRPDNHRVRIRAKRRVSARVQSVLRREGRGQRLSPAQRELLRRYRKAPTVLMATCHVCNHTARRTGANRDMVATISNRYSTPHKSPKPANQSSMTTPKTPKDKTPSTKKSPMSCLKKLLKLEDSQKTKKIGLKNFLSSL